MCCPPPSHEHRRAASDTFSPVVFALRNHKIKALRELLTLVRCKPGDPRRDADAATSPPPDAMLSTTTSAIAHSLSRRSIRVGLVNTFDAYDADASQQSAETVVDLAAQWGHSEAMSLILAYRQGFFVSKHDAQKARIPDAVTQASPSTVQVRGACCMRGHRTGQAVRRRVLREWFVRSA